jgi:hypothetical protein
VQSFGCQTQPGISLSEVHGSYIPQRSAGV